MPIDMLVDWGGRHPMVVLWLAAFWPSTPEGFFALAMMVRPRPLWEKRLLNVDRQNYLLSNVFFGNETHERR